MRKTKRLSKDKYYLEIAKAVALRSPCLRRKYGAIVVKEDAIVSTGYNGPARGSTNCEVGCVKDILNLPHYSSYDLCPAIHAEENCVINAARIGSSVLGGTLYLYGIDVRTGKTVKGVPCYRCRRVLLNAGIKCVITMDENGNVIQMDVEKWAEEDKNDYIKRVKEAKRKSLSKVY